MRTFLTQTSATTLILPSPLTQGRGNFLSPPGERIKVRGRPALQPTLPPGMAHHQRRKPMTPLFNLSLAGYFAALLLAAANLFTREQRKFATAATIVLTAGLITQTAYIIMRWLAAGRAP